MRFLKRVLRRQSVLRANGGPAGLAAKMKQTNNHGVVRKNDIALVCQTLDVDNEYTQPDYIVDSIPVDHDEINPLGASGEYFLYNLAAGDSNPYLTPLRMICSLCFGN